MSSRIHNPRPGPFNYRASIRARVSPWDKSTAQCIFRIPLLVGENISYNLNGSDWCYISLFCWPHDWDHPCLIEAMFWWDVQFLAWMIQFGPVEVIRYPQSKTVGSANLAPDSCNFDCFDQYWQGHHCKPKQ